MAEKTLDLFPTDLDVAAGENSVTSQEVFAPSVFVGKHAGSFKISRFIPAAATNAERLYPHAPLLNVPADKSSIQPKPVPRRLWLALNLPLLPLAPLIVTSATPAVVVEIDGTAQTVLAANVAAQQMGIVSGMHLNSACALASNLAALKRDPAQERQTLERLATWALQYTPCVSLAASDALLLEVKGSLRLFGGARALRQRMFAELREMGIVATAAIAPTSAAALWLARSAGPYPNVPNLMILRKYLERLPLSCLRWPESACSTLQDLGIRTVGECLRLPRDGLARRIGVALLQELDQATGRAAQPRLQYVPREVYKGRRDFDMEVESTSMLRYFMEPLLEELELFLRVRTAGMQALKILLRHRELAATRLILRFVSSISLKQHLEGILQERLARLGLPAPVLAVRIESGPLQSLQSQALNENLFGPTAEQATDRIPRLIEKLRARLGDEAVYRVRLTEDHRPEYAYRITKDFRARIYRRKGSNKRGLRSSVSGLQPETESVRCALLPTAHSLQPTACQRPLWLLSPPEPLLLKRDQLYLNGPLTLESGPERIEGGWWDNANIRRDYYVARDQRGVRLWIFYERGKWLLHGRFG